MQQRSLPEEPQPPQRGRKRTLRPAILEAATELFSRRGFERPTMDEVAAAAGVRKATLYSYFDGRSALIDAVIDKLLRELPALRSTDGALPLHRQFIDVGLQLQELAAHPATVALTARLADQRLSAEQLFAWRSRHEEYESFLAGLLERHCDCEHPRQAARLFVLLAAAGQRPESAAQDSRDPSGIECAVDFLLRAYPQQHDSSD